jgi:hypothetical protein
MKNLEVKLELERIFKEYCLQDLPEGLKDGGDDDFNRFYDWMVKYIDFRLYVSGGDKSSMGSIGCGSVNGFLNELFMFDDMVCDWHGCYRGEFASECFDSLVEFVNNSSLEDNIKNEIYNGYKEYYKIEY